MVKMMNSVGFSVFVLVVAIVISAFAQIPLKKSAMKEHKSKWAEYLNANVIISYSIYLVSTVLTVYAYKGMPYIMGSILQTLSYILVAILGYFFFGEKMNKRQIFGFVLIITGIGVYAVF